MARHFLIALGIFTVAVLPSSEAAACRDGSVSGAASLTSMRPRSPVLRRGTDDFLLAYTEDCGATRDLVSLHLDAGGISLGVAELLSDAVADADHVALAAGEDGWLSVWAETTTDGRISIRGALVDAKGSCAGDSFTIGGSDAYDPRPAVAYADGAFLVVWERRMTADAAGLYRTAIVGARVSQAGILLDVTPVTLSVPGADPQAPALASDGTGFLVAWAQSGPHDADLFAAQVAVGGAGSALVVGGPFAISTAAGDQLAPSLAFDGKSYLVAWQDSRDPVPVNGSDIYAARVLPGGVVLETAGVAVAAGGVSGVPSVGADERGFFVAYTENGDELRARAITVAGVAALDTLRLTSATGTKLSSSVASLGGAGYLTIYEQAGDGAASISAALVLGDASGGATVEVSGTTIASSVSASGASGGCSIAGGLAGRDGSEAATSQRVLDGCTRSTGGASMLLVLGGLLGLLMVRASSPRRRRAATSN